MSLKDALTVMDARREAKAILVAVAKDGNPTDGDRGCRS